MTGAGFGLGSDEVRGLVDLVHPGGDEDSWADRFARIAWSTLAEPGDAAAGALIAELGAAGALELLLARAGSLDSGVPVPAPAPTVSGKAAPSVPPGRAPGDASDAAGTAIAPGGLEASVLLAGIARWSPRLSARAVVRSIEQAARFGIRCVVPGDPWWPAALADLGPSAPSVLWVRGDPGALVAARRRVALVGARAATGYGEHVAVELAAGLAERGVLVVSGGAYGIDGAVHRAALGVGAPTVAALAGGLDRCYPAGHEDLFTRIMGAGALVAEVPCGVPPTRWRFLQRNRVIATVADATVVVEAGHRSGSLNTAGHAAAIGRPLGAVPGPVTSAASAGCHRLLREYAATCVTSVDEVLELLGARDDAVSDGGARDAAWAIAPAAASVAAEPDLPGTGSAVRVLDALSPRVPRDAAAIAALAGMSVAEALAVLGALEASARVRRTEDGRWIRPSDARRR